MTALTRKILDGKRERRKSLAGLSYPEKVRIVEKLREASKKMAKGWARPRAAVSEGRIFLSRARPLVRRISKTRFSHEKSHSQKHGLPVVREQRCGGGGAVLCVGLSR